MRIAPATFWAWTLSIVFHLSVLLVLAFYTFSSADQPQDLPAPTASVTTPEPLNIEPQVTPKPAVLPPPTQKVSAEKVIAATVIPQLSPVEIAPTPTVPEPFTEPVAAMPLPAVITDANANNSAEFFGHKAPATRICVVIDSSGSMIGIFGRVLRELTELLDALQPNQYFTVIFFGDSQIHQFSNDRLVPASGSNLSAALEFAAAIKPTGQTNAMPALEKALLCRDPQNRPSQIIYFVSDGFELTDQGFEKFRNQLSALLNNCPTKAKIVPIAFWPQPEDLKFLDELAARTAGDVIVIKD